MPDLGIDLLIYSAVSDLFTNMIKAHVIRIIPFVTGAMDEVLEDFLRGGLFDSKSRIQNSEIIEWMEFKEVD